MNLKLDIRKFSLKNIFGYRCIKLSRQMVRHVSKMKENVTY